MWYEKGNTLKLDQPIFAYGMGDNATTYLLTAQQEKDTYRIHSYSWLNIKTGSYNSNCFRTAQAAIDSYDASYNIYNGELKAVR